MNINRRSSPEDDANYAFDVEEVDVVDSEEQLERSEDDIESEATIPSEVIV